MSNTNNAQPPVPEEVSNLQGDPNVQQQQTDSPPVGRNAVDTGKETHNTDNPDFKIDIDNFQGLQNENRISMSGIIPGTNQNQNPQPEETKKPNEPAVQNVEDDGNGFFITGINTHGGEDNQVVETRMIEEDEEPAEMYDEQDFDPADKYKHLAVVDCSKSFSNQECVLISDKERTISYLNVHNLVSFKFDSLVTSHSQVQHICNRLIHKFINPIKRGEKDKIVLNLADQFNSNNNAGFNLTNFKVKFINQFFQDVINDYEKSLIGTFTKSLLDKINGDERLKEEVELYFTITKFENDIGFSLIHQDGEVDPNESQENLDIIQESNKNREQTEDNTQQRAQSPDDAEDQFQINPKSPQQMRDQQLRAQRKAQLTKHGVIPEFIKINEIYQVYTAFTQANLKNSILHQKQAKKYSIQYDEPMTNYKETELKEDILTIQFKLIDKASFRTLNTFTFINLPLSKQTDNNVGTLIEILNKFKKQAQQKQMGKKKNQNDFIPYNKSILTRVIAEQLQKNNMLVLSHFSKQSINQHFKHSTGPAKNLFSQIDTLFGDKKGVMERKKLNDQQALKVLQKKFKRETQQIFGQLDQFRDGAKSIEVYTQQAASQMPKSLAVKGSVTPNMFQQILQFLSFKDEIIQGYEEGNTQSLFMRQMPTHDIQKVIFDKNYIKFTKQRQQAHEVNDAMKQQMGYMNTVGYGSNAFLPNQLTMPPINHDPAQGGYTQMNRLQYVQYECIKTELKEEYDKRVNFLHKRIEKRQAQQGPYQDAHLILMQNSMGDLNNSRSGKGSQRNKFGTSTASGQAQNNEFFLPGMNNRNETKGSGYGPPQSYKSNERRPRNYSNYNKNQNDGGVNTSMQNQEKEQYYKFYLDSAQKAIEMMRKQHKSASIMRLKDNENTHKSYDSQGLMATKTDEFGMYTQSQPSFPNQYNSAINIDNNPHSQADQYSQPIIPNTNNASKSTRVLDPLYPMGGKNSAQSIPGYSPERNQNNDLTKSTHYQPKMDMIHEDGDQISKPFSAAHGTRQKLKSMQGNNEYLQDIRGTGGNLSKQSTSQNTYTKPVSNMKGKTEYGFGNKSGSNIGNLKPINRTVKTSGHPSAGFINPSGVANRGVQKSFRPLRHEGRLGAAISQDRGEAYISNTAIESNPALRNTLNGTTPQNYNSISNFTRTSNSQPKNLLGKSKSNKKSLQPLNKYGETSPASNAAHSKTPTQIPKGPSQGAHSRQQSKQSSNIEKLPAVSTAKQNEKV